MLEFKKHNVPLTVATVDMDWHWVDVKSNFRMQDTIKRDRCFGQTDGPDTAGTPSFSPITGAF